MRFARAESGALAAVTHSSKTTCHLVVHGTTRQARDGRWAARGKCDTPSASKCCGPSGLDSLRRGQDERFADESVECEANRPDWENGWIFPIQWARIQERMVYEGDQLPDGLPNSE